MRGSTHADAHARRQAIADLLSACSLVDEAMERLEAIGPGLDIEPGSLIPYQPRMDIVAAGTWFMAGVTVAFLISMVVTLVLP